MAARTPEIIATARWMLPPSPDATIVLVAGEQGEGEDRYQPQDVYMDLLLHGRVLGPREEVQEALAAGEMGRWESSWRNAPLVIDAAGLVECIMDLAPDLDYDRISINAIGLVLAEHPGPVRCIRVESSGRLSPDVTGLWLEQLQAKEQQEEGRGGLEELVLMNTEGIKNMPFPLDSLPSGLKKLSLGFFGLAPLDGDHLSSLVELRLTGCAFCGAALSSLMPELHSLRVIVLGCCCLTSACGPDGLNLVSNSLLRLQMWSCTAAGGISLYTPRLYSLCTGVRPMDGTRIQIDLRTPGPLRELHGLMLYIHDISYSSPYANKYKLNSKPTYSPSELQLQGRRIAPLPHLVKFRLCIQMSDKQQMTNLLDLLRNLPNLKEIILSRMDDIHPAEELQIHQEAFAIPCIAGTLQALVLNDFRGGAAEIGFITHVVALARELTAVTLHPHSSMPYEAANQASIALLMSPKASAQVSLVIVPNG